VEKPNAAPLMTDEAMPISHLFRLVTFENIEFSDEVVEVLLSGS